MLWSRLTISQKLLNKLAILPIEKKKIVSLLVILHLKSKKIWILNEKKNQNRNILRLIFKYKKKSKLYSFRH